MKNTWSVFIMMMAIMEMETMMLVHCFDAYGAVKRGKTGCNDNESSGK